MPIVYSDRVGITVKKRLITKPWHTSYNNPYVGIQIFSNRFRNGSYKFKNSVGRPLIISGFYESNFLTGKTISFGYYLGLGAAFNWKPYSTNYTNIALGSKTSFYIEMGLNLKKEITNYLALGLNLGLTHYSNGATKLPNFGINIGNTFLSVDYKLGKNQKIQHHEYKESFKRKTHFDLSVFASSKSTLIKIDSFSLNKYKVRSYPVYGISGVVSRDLDRKNKFGIGLTFTINPTNKVVQYQKELEEKNPNNIIYIEDSEVPKDLSKDIMISSYLAYELKVGQVSVLVQPSFYLNRGVKLDYIPSFYQRVGIRYNTKRKFFVGFNLRSYKFKISDFIEWNLGYSF